MAPIKTFEFEAITAEQIRTYCEASGDFNKIHLDDDFARAAGLPGIIAHGMLSMGLAGRAVAEWGYPIQKMRKFDAKFKDKVVPGDRLRAELDSDEGGQLSLRILNQNGAEILTASIRLAQE